MLMNRRNSSIFTLVYKKFSVKMKVFTILQLIASLALLGGVHSQANSILYPHDIQGTGYQSSFVGKSVNNVQGVITAKEGTNNCYIQTPDDQIDNDNRTSEGLYIFRSNVCSDFAIGDLIQIGSAKVAEYSTSKTNLHLTELTNANQTTLIRSNAKSASAVIIGTNGNRTPPQKYIGIKNPFAVPANQTTLEGGDRAKSLDVTTYGADFWESLENSLVTLTSPTVLGPLTSYGEVYVVASGLKNPSQNDRGGLTLAADENATSEDTRWDSNPQAIQLVQAFDGSDLDATIRLGDVLEDVTGIIGYDFGLYTITPFTAPKIVQRKSGDAIPAPFKSTGKCDNFLAATFNVENLSPANSSRITKIGGYIDSHLKDPDVVVLNEIQDNDGPTDDGVVNANMTLDAIVSAVKGTSYNYAYINPANDKDGGEPGGNIRQAFIYRNDTLKLTPGVPVGGTNDAVDVKSVNGKARLTLNPGRIDPNNTAWKNSRKPLVGQFDLQDGSGQNVIVIGVHLTSKGGSGTNYQNPQAPINGGEDARNSQAQVLRDFVQKILQVQSDAKVIVTGDFNEFSYVRPLNTLTNGSPSVLKEVIISKRVERYSYIFQQNCQELDHLFVSPSIAQAGASLWVPHINTWAAAADQVSDHDPVVSKLNVC